MKKNILDPLEKQNTEEEDFKSERESFYNCLTKEQQLLVFCEIMNKLVDAELNQGKTYRGILYDTFGFNYDAYEKAQLSGFLRLHEKINSDKKISLLDFSMRLLNAYGIKANKKEIEKKINTFDQ